MVLKTTFHLAIMVVVGTAIAVSLAVAGDLCSELVTRHCLACHDKENYCSLLGAKETTVRTTITEMIANGAELSRDDVKDLIPCLVHPSPDVLMSCH